MPTTSSPQPRSPRASPRTPARRTSPNPIPRGYTNQSSQNVPRASTSPQSALTRLGQSAPSAAAATASSPTRTYDGAMTFVGSSFVRQSTTASATPTGTRTTSGSRVHCHPTASPTSPLPTAEAAAAFQASPGVAAIAVYASLAVVVVRTWAPPDATGREGVGAGSAGSGIRAMSAGTPRPPTAPTTAVTAAVSSAQVMAAG